jgi:hypothetical protein
VCVFFKCVFNFLFNTTTFFDWCPFVFSKSCSIGACSSYCLCKVIRVLPVALQQQLQEAERIVVAAVTARKLALPGCLLAPPNLSTIHPSTLIMLSCHLIEFLCSLSVMLLICCQVLGLQATVKCSLVCLLLPTAIQMKVL